MLPILLYSKPLNILILLLVSSFIATVSADGVACESISTIWWWWFEHSDRLTCDMRESTIIDATGIEITSEANDTIEALYLDLNDDIEYLPENIADKFPNLVIISAFECNIKRVSASNFRNLGKLRGLSLKANQIERIENGTFDDLTSLELLYLRKNL